MTTDYTHRFAAVVPIGTLAQRKAGKRLARFIWSNDDTDGEGLHDDCLMALVLARFGSVHGWDGTDPLKGDYTGFAEKAGDEGPAVDLGEWGPIG